MNDFKNISDKYKQQMMDLYKRNPQVMPTLSNFSDNPIEKKDVPKEPITEDTKPIESSVDTSPQDESTPMNDDIPLEEKYPPPVIPPFIYEDDTPTLPPKEDISNVEVQQPNLNSIGYLKVITTSANETLPISEASVIISKTENGKENLLYSLFTNANGETPIIALPTPSAEMSQSPENIGNGIKPYANYNISTYLDGYYQVKNLNVPIFAGITSIQRVNMIPLPVHTHERKVITFSETEPNL